MSNIDNFTCSICLNIFENPVQCTKCSNNFCQECVKKLKRCPLCNEEPFEYKLNIWLKRTISEWEFYCPNGCGMKFNDRNELNKHTLICNFCEVKCSICKYHGNEEMLWAHLIEKHKKDIMDHFIIRTKGKDEKSISGCEDEKNNIQFSDSSDDEKKTGNNSNKKNSSKKNYSKNDNNKNDIKNKNNINDGNDNVNNDNVYPEFDEIEQNNNNFNNNQNYSNNNNVNQNNNYNFNNNHNNDNKNQNYNNFSNNKSYLNRNNNNYQNYNNNNYQSYNNNYQNYNNNNFQNNSINFNNNQNYQNYNQYQNQNQNQKVINKNFNRANSLINPDLPQMSQIQNQYNNQNSEIKNVLTNKIKNVYVNPFSTSTIYNNNNSILNNLYFCNSRNNDIKCDCCKDHICRPGNCMCVSCMRKNKQNFGLREDELINKAGRIARLDRGDYFCGCQFEETFTNVIGKVFTNKKECKLYSQCNDCKVLKKFMKEYLPESVYMRIKGDK